jgi:hypothetical protein
MTYSSSESHPYGVSDMTSQCSISSRLDSAPGNKDESEIEEPYEPSQRGSEEKSDESKLASAKLYAGYIQAYHFHSSV